MKSGFPPLQHRRLKHVLGLTLALAGTGQAQNMAAYTKLAGQLDAALGSSGKDALKTLQHLEKAESALAELAPSITSQQVNSGLRDTLNAARAAQARTPAELQAQVLLARGLMRKALYDQTVSALVSSAEDGTGRLNLLAREFGLSSAGAQALSSDAKNGQVGRVVWRLQNAAAAKTSAALGSVQASQSPASYLNLARATSWFTVVQDAAQNVTPSTTVTQFNQALTELAQGDTAALKTSLSRLKTGVSSLNRSLVSPERAAAAAQASGKKVPVVVTPVTRSQTPTKPSTVKTTSSAPVATSGSTGIGSGLNSAYASLGRALTAVGHSDSPRARQELAGVSAALASAPAKVRQAAGYQDYLSDLKAAAQRKGLRSSDVQALIAGLGKLEDRAAGNAGSALDGFSSGSAQVLGGPVRAILYLLLALLSALPLYLLNLAFGGRNPYWRAINIALLLLLLPTITEGVFGFLGWLGDLTGVSFLRSLTNLTFSQGAYALPWHLLFTTLAIGLAAYGFRGLCVQFGLLGAGSQRAKAPAAASLAQTSVDWDEELS